MAVCAASWYNHSWKKYIATCSCNIDWCNVHVGDSRHCHSAWGTKNLWLTSCPKVESVLSLKSGSQVTGLVRGLQLLIQSPDIRWTSNSVARASMFWQWGNMPGSHWLFITITKEWSIKYKKGLEKFGKGLKAGPKRPHKPYYLHCVCMCVCVSVCIQTWM